jgi:toxin YoeB
MELTWNKRGWDDYLYWQKTDKQILKRINELSKDCLREPFDGIGKPEPLKDNYRGYWSRRINDEHRLIYKVNPDRLTILQCRFQY